jgi:integrase
MERLRWDDVNLATGVLRVRGTKTAAAERTVTLLPLLRDELVALKARSHPDRTTLVFGTSRGGKDSPSNVRRRKLAKAVERRTRTSPRRTGRRFPTS